MGKTSDNFIKTIKEYLDNYAQQNELFAKKYGNKNKTIEECCGFIVEEVKKMNVNGLTDDEVYYLARHYYEEEDLKGKPFSGANVVVNHQIVLTEEEKQKLKKEAEEEYKQELIEEMEEKAKQEKKKKEKILALEIKKKEQKIEKIKKKIEEEGQMSLFDF